MKISRCAQTDIYIVYIHHDRTKHMRTAAKVKTESYQNIDKYIIFIMSTRIEIDWQGLAKYQQERYNVDIKTLVQR